MSPIATAAAAIFAFVISCLTSWCTVFAIRKAVRAELGDPDRFSMESLEALDTQAATLQARIRYLRQVMYKTCPPIEPECALYANSVASVEKAIRAINNLIINVESKIPPSVPEEDVVASTSGEKM